MRKARLISLILAIALIFTSLPIVASANEDTPAVTDGYMTITERSGWTSGALLTDDFVLEAGKTYTLKVDARDFGKATKGDNTGSIGLWFESAFLFRKEIASGTAVTAKDGWYTTEVQFTPTKGGKLELLFTGGIDSNNCDMGIDNLRIYADGAIVYGLDFNTPASTGNWKAHNHSWATAGDVSTVTMVDVNNYAAVGGYLAVTERYAKSPFYTGIKAKTPVVIEAGTSYYVEFDIQTDAINTRDYYIDFISNTNGARVAAVNDTRLDTATNIEGTDWYTIGHAFTPSTGVGTTLGMCFRGGTTNNYYITDENGDVVYKTDENGEIVVENGYKVILTINGNYDYDFNIDNIKVYAGATPAEAAAKENLVYLGDFNNFYTTPDVEVWGSGGALEGKPLAKAARTLVYDADAIADAEAVAAVEAAIAAIVTTDDAAAARAAYDNLDAELKSLVTNYNELVAAENKFASLESGFLRIPERTRMWDGARLNTGITTEAGATYKLYVDLWAEDMTQDFRLEMRDGTNKANKNDKAYNSGALTATDWYTHTVEIASAAANGKLVVDITGGATGVTKGDTCGRPEGLVWYQFYSNKYSEMVNVYEQETLVDNVRIVKVVDGVETVVYSDDFTALATQGTWAAIDPNYQAYTYDAATDTYTKVPQADEYPNGFNLDIVSDLTAEKDSYVAVAARTAWTNGITVNTGVTLPAGTYTVKFAAKAFAENGTRIRGNNGMPDKYISAYAAVLGRDGWYNVTFPLTTTGEGVYSQQIFGSGTLPNKETFAIDDFYVYDAQGNVVYSNTFSNDTDFAAIALYGSGHNVYLTTDALEVENADMTKVQAAIDAINAIGTVGRESSPEIEAAKAAYAAIGTYGSTLVTNAADLALASETFGNITKAVELEARIDALPAVDASAMEIVAAKAAITTAYNIYNGSDCENYFRQYLNAGYGDKITALYNAIPEAEKNVAAEYTAEKAAIVAAIAELPEADALNASNKDLYKATVADLTARAAALPAEYAIDAASAEKLAAVAARIDAIELEAAAPVIELINTIGNVTLDKADAIAAARKAYEALDDVTKAKVSNLATLEAAEARLAALVANQTNAYIAVAGRTGWGQGVKLTTKTLPAGAYTITFAAKACSVAEGETAKIRGNVCGTAFADVTLNADPAITDRDGWELVSIEYTSDEEKALEVLIWGGSNAWSGIFCVDDFYVYDANGELVYSNACATEEEIGAFEHCLDPAFKTADHKVYATTDAIEAEHADLAQTAIDAINAIGEVDRTSGPAIEAAKAALAEVENYGSTYITNASLLANASMKFTNISKAVELEAAIDALPAADAEDVELLTAAKDIRRAKTIYDSKDFQTYQLEYFTEGYAEKLAAIVAALDAAEARAEAAYTAEKEALETAIAELPTADKITGENFDDYAETVEDLVARNEALPEAYKVGEEAATKLAAVAAKVDEFKAIAGETVAEIEAAIEIIAAFEVTVQNKEYIAGEVATIRAQIADLPKGIEISEEAAAKLEAIESMLKAGFTVTVDNAEIETSNAAQTVVMEIKAAADFEVDGIYFTVKVPEGWSIASIAGGEKIDLTADDLGSGAVAWSSEDSEDVALKAGDVIATVTYTVPANVAAGTYEVGVENAEITCHYASCIAQAEAADAQVEVSEKAESVISGTIKDNGVSLILDAEIIIKNYFKFTTFTVNGEQLTSDYILANGGMLSWIGELPADPTFDSAGVYVSEFEYDSKNKEYSAKTIGISSWLYAKNVYLRPYVIVDGEYIYGDVKTTGVKIYAEGRFEKSTNENLKSTLVGLLNYGAEAQKYFKLNTDDLANKDLESYVERFGLNSDYFDLNWDDSYLTPLVVPTAEMTANFQDTGTLTDDGKSLILKGAISVKYYFSIGKDLTNFTNATKKMYFWTAADYAAIEARGEILTKENASYVVEASEFNTNTTNVNKYGYECDATSDGIYAMYYGDTIFSAMCITDNNGVEHCSGVVTYSPEFYAEGKIMDGNVATIDPLAEWLVVYGNRSKIYFNK